MFNFVASYIMPFFVFFPINGGANMIFGFLMGEQKRSNFQRKAGCILGLFGQWYLLVFIAAFIVRQS